MSNKDSNLKGNTFFGDYQFHGEKLKLARELHCMTITDLSKRIGVSHQMVSNYENEKRLPTEERLKSITEALQLPRGFFFKNTFTDGERTSPSFFRKGAAVPKKYQTQVEGYTKIYSSVKKLLSTKVNLPKFTQPKFSLIQKDFRQIDFNDIELLAENLRDFHDLGNGPISNMTLLCEKMGISIFFADLHSAKIDAHTVFIDNAPYIILNKSRKSSVRLRFNIAHELGHILMHHKYDEKVISSTTNHRRIEAEANHFAGCFLMPESGLSLDMAASNLNYLISLKYHWKASLQAIIYRAEQIGLFSSTHTLHLRQQISRNKWRLFEPLDDEIPIEKPKVISLGIQHLIKNNPNFLDELLHETGLPYNMVIDIYPDIDNVTRHKTSTNKNNVINLF